jgi:hypothetical protein
MQTRLHGQPSRLLWLWLLSGLLLLAYALPWVTHPAASLSPGGYDFAEWTSLHPSVRGMSPTLLTTLLLRLPLTCIALIMAFIPGQRLIGGIIVLLLVVAQLPPLEFFSSARGDLNYQQQFTLALITLIGGVVGTGRWLNRLHRPMIALLALIGAVSAGIGMTQGLALLGAYHLSVQAGIGGGLLILLNGVCCLTFSLNAVSHIVSGFRGTAGQPNNTVTLPL